MMCSVIIILWNLYPLIPGLPGKCASRCFSRRRPSPAPPPRVSPPQLSSFGHLLQERSPTSSTCWQPALAVWGRLHAGAGCPRWSWGKALELGAVLTSASALFKAQRAKAVHRGTERGLRVARFSYGAVTGLNRWIHNLNSVWFAWSSEILDNGLCKFSMPRVSEYLGHVQLPLSQAVGRDRSWEVLQPAPPDLLCCC